MPFPGYENIEKELKIAQKSGKDQEFRCISHYFSK